jgi:hypothetical protein
VGVLLPLLLSPLIPMDLTGSVSWLEAMVWTQVVPAVLCPLVVLENVAAGVSQEQRCLRWKKDAMLSERLLYYSEMMVSWVELEVHFSSSRLVREGPKKHEITNSYYHPQSSEWGVAELFAH